MRRWKKIVLLSVAIVFTGAAVFIVPTVWFKPWSINHFYGRVFLEFMLRHPMILSQLRILEPMGLDFHSDDLDDISIEFQRREAREIDRSLEILRSYDRDRMSESQLLSTDVLDWFLADLQAGNRFMFHDYPLNQMGGLQSQLPNFMINVHQINNAEDAENYIIRVTKFGVFFDQALEGLRLREERKIIPPKFVIQKVLKEMKEFTEVSPGENPIFENFHEKVEALSLDSDEQADLERRLEAAVRDVAYPAYGRLIDYYEYLEPIATTDDGAWKLPDGEAFYADRLRSFTTTDLTAEEIHQLGLKEVARIQGEMRAILRAEGLPHEDFAATMQRLNKEPRFLYPDTDEGREQILADYQVIIDEIDANLDDLFDVRPDVGVQVKRAPEFMEETAPGAYYQPAPMDASTPGTFYVNLRSVEEIPKFGMRTLAYHEAIPGHHFQIGVAQGLTDLPFFRRIVPFTAYVEGWALYAEQAAAEGGFQEDPYDRLGYLTGDLFRAARLVVDTGIHAKRWTREQAIEYMLDNTGMPETDIIAEVERYIVFPGQACAYKVGQLRILELRERAREQLGDGFDIKEFHNVLLTNGALPLSLLEQVVDAWIQSETS